VDASKKIVATGIVVFDFGLFRGGRFQIIRAKPGDIRPGDILNLGTSYLIHH
jgi:hypothetical protein